MNLFNTSLQKNSGFVVQPDLSLCKPSVFNRLFKAVKFDNKVLFENLKNSMAVATKKITPENSTVFSDNLDVLYESGKLTSLQVGVLKDMAAKLIK